MGITRAELKNNNAGSSVTLTNPVAIGDLLICIGNWATAGGSYSVSDNINSGSYTQAQSENVTSSGYHIFGVFYKVCTAAGTPTITLSAADSPQRLVVLHYTGFAGTPTFPVADNNFAQATAGTALNSGSFSSSVANEHAIAWFNDSGGHTPPTANSPFGAALLGGYQEIPFDTLAAFPSGMPINTSVALVGTISAADNWGAGVVGFYDAVSGATPTVTAVNSGASIAEGAPNVAVTGTNFASGMTAAILQPGGVSVPQTFTYGSATSGTFNLTMEPGTGSQLAFTDATYTTDLEVTVGANTSAPFAITLAPPSGLVFETLASVNANSSYRITATPDLAVGDQLEAAGNAAGSAAVPTGLTLNNDGTFSFAVGDTPANFYVRRYNSSLGWSAYALQSVGGALPTGGAQCGALADFSPVRGLTLW